MKMIMKIFIIVLIIAAPAIAFCVSSTNYNIHPDENIDSSKEQLDSPNYKMWGSVEPIAGESKKGNKKILHGSVLEKESVPVPPPPAPDGGTVHTIHLIPDELEFDETDPKLSQIYSEFRRFGKLAGNTIDTYSDDYLLQGSKDPDSKGPWINNSREGVVSERADRWHKPIKLNLGDNVFSAYLKNDYGKSKTEHLIVHRRLIGDVNDNKIVDDYDLSLFASQWKIEGIPGWSSDFNEDFIVDDYDLSLIAAYWNESY